MHITYISNAQIDISVFYSYCLRRMWVFISEDSVKFNKTNLAIIGFLRDGRLPLNGADWIRPL